jgi:hypothetical protein
LPNGAITVRDWCDRFLTAKQHLLSAGEITRRTFADYSSATDRLVRVFGKDRPITNLTAEDFGSLRGDMAKTLGPVSLANEIQRCRTIFKMAYDTCHLDNRSSSAQGPTGATTQAPTIAQSTPAAFRQNHLSLQPGDCRFESMNGR